MNKLQETVKQFCHENHMNADIESRYIDLSSELGELGKEILKGTDYGTKDFSRSKDLALEMGDLLFSLLALANTCDVDIEKALSDVLEKYRRRLAKGSAGSEND
jgi:NTP pyrophosphatase (non-canonical NTP hydrolase)